MNVTPEMVAAARQAYWDECEVTTGDVGMRLAIEAAIALMRGQSWQSVDDGFPPKHQWVLIYHDGFSVGRYWPCEKGVHDDNEWNWEVVGSDWVDNVTHWQPLPSPPKDTSDEQ